MKQVLAALILGAALLLVTSETDRAPQLKVREGERDEWFHFLVDQIEHARRHVPSAPVI
jgi:hypothetical protein